MTRLLRTRAVALVLPVIAACTAQHVDRSGTLATLHEVRPDTTEVPVDHGLDQAVQSYGEFLQQAPDSSLAPEAMRRLADLKLEKDFGIQGDGRPAEPPALPSGDPAPSIGPTSGAAQYKPAANSGPGAAAALHAPAIAKIDARTNAQSRSATPGSDPSAVSERDLEQRAAVQHGVAPASPLPQLALPTGMNADASRAGPLEAIKLYDELLAKFPHYALRDQVLYQKARAYDELGQTEDAMQVMEQLVREDPHSRFAEEVQFRRAERLFILKKYR